MKDNHEFRVIRLRELPLPIPCCDCPERIYEYWVANVSTASWYNPECECLVAIHLNTRRRATGFHLVAMGTMDSVLSSPREVFRTAIIRSAAALVLAHNHPSGCPDPSENDIRVTRDLMRAGQLLKIEVVDHVVVGRPEPDRPRPWVSLREMGYFQ
ncbi:MAG TPA: JAB domain-containing protein [Verrucomicrobiota bacterium]|nr:JAB domain-containing protein [Verrucomicrobiota bacterium]HNU50165.1 JAB domain-containing protein [Verrucomicrobiota bacterium]